MLSLALALFIVPRAEAQYYSWGADPSSLKWQSIKSEESEVQMIYPDTLDAVARRTLLYIENMGSDIHHGFTYPALKIPFVMHPENFASNGLVMWLPKRIEFLTSPATNSYSMPWIKQLVAHEYRHAVQYNNLNQGAVKAASYVLGQQGSVAGLAFLPLYMLEGDAVMNETQMSTFGRALQPRFSMGYRAIGRDILAKGNPDKWYCGSYLTYIPDHYEFGYQTVSYAYTRYGDQVIDRIASYGVRKPYMITTVTKALDKYYGTSSNELFRDTFTDLNDYWDSLPERENSAKIISQIDTDNFTTYSYPMPYGEDGDLLLLKEDYNKPKRFVLRTKGGEESRVAYTGDLSTRPSLGETRVWWSEYRRSTLFDERVNSQLCYMDVEVGRPRSIESLRNVLYPTVVAESQDGTTSRLAYVEYESNGLFTIVEIELEFDRKGRYKEYTEISRTEVLYPTEVHGLAWDNKSCELYFIATDNSGMWLGKRDMASTSGFQQLRDGAYITLSDLRAKDGVLYFGSIESGYDELHSFDLATGTEHRVTESKYGSFDSSTPVGGKIYGTCYNRYGYHLAESSSDSDLGEVQPTSTPQNIVNPQRVQWDVVNLDTVDYTTIAATQSHEKHKAKRYHKGLNLINIHSWAPVAMNPFSLTEENQLYLSMGATVMSQNLLSTLQGYGSYGYNVNEGDVVSGGVIYSGWGVNLEAAATYGGDQVVYNPFYFNFYGTERYLSISTSATLPLYFQRGYHTRQLSLTALWNYSNGLVADLDNIVYDPEEREVSNINFETGLQKLAFSVSYSNSVRAAMRDIATPFAYSVGMSYSLSPSDRNFSDLLSLTAKLYTPGLAPHNSFKVALCYQNSIGGYQLEGINLMTFQSSSLIPEGFSTSDIINNNYWATSLNYKFPLCYPEGGISSILYIKRIVLGLGFDAATFEDYYLNRHDIYSYGVSVTADINVARLPAAGTTAVEFSLYRNNMNSLTYQFGVALPF